MVGNKDCRNYGTRDCMTVGEAIVWVVVMIMLITVGVIFFGDSKDPRDGFPGEAVIAVIGMIVLIVRSWFRGGR